MPTVIIRGSADLVEQPQSISATAGKGQTTTRVWRGSQASITAQRNTMYASGWQTEMKEEGRGALWTLTATLAGDVAESAPEPQWEIIPHTIERNILECNDRTLIANLSSDTKALLEYCNKNPTTSSQFVAEGAGLDEINNANFVLNLMRVGVESRQEFTIAVRRTITVSRNYSAGWSLSNVGKVLSTSALVGSYSIPIYVSELLPTSDSSVQAEGTLDSKIYVFKGFLEQHPTYQSANNNRIQIQQEWLFNKWSAGDNGLYDVIN